MTRRAHSQQGQETQGQSQLSESEQAFVDRALPVLEIASLDDRNSMLVVLSRRIVNLLAGLRGPSTPEERGSTRRPHLDVKATLHRCPIHC